MEPFALFRILESLFNQNPATSPTSPPTSNAEPPVQAESEPTSETIKKETSESAPPSSAQEAVLGFLSAHDARANRTKRR